MTEPCLDIDDLTNALSLMNAINGVAMQGAGFDINIGVYDSNGELCARIKNDEGFLALYYSR